MVDGVKEILDKYSTIDKIVVEEVRPDVGSSNIQTHRALSWLQAAFAIMVHDDYKKIEIEYIYPSSWRAKCGIQTGRGIKRTTLKQADINFVKENYGIEVNDDIADAICIGHAYIHKEEKDKIERVMIRWD